MKRAIYLLLAAALLAPALSAQEQDVKYVNNSFARISHIAGTAFLQRAQDLGYEDAELNAPVAEGDRIGTSDGRLEIYLGKRVYVRLDQNSKIDFASLPRRDNAVTRIRQWSGHMYLDVGALAKEKSIEVLTDDATFYVLDRGLYRIDVRDGGGTEIMVLEGMIEAAGEDGSMLIKDSQRLVLVNGAFQGKPTAFFAAGFEDAFDRFNSSRLAVVRRGSGRGYLPEERGLYKKAKLGEVLEYLAVIKGAAKPDARASIDAWLARFDLLEWKNRKVSELSKGMAQKAQFVGAIAHNPSVVFFDEPFSGLDPLAQDQLLKVMTELKGKGATILFSTHIMEHAEKICERILLMHKGREVLSGTMAEIKTRYGRNAVQLEFDGDAGFIKHLDFVASVSEYPRWVEVELKDGVDSDLLYAALAGRLSIRRFETVAPSLHKIFITQIGGLAAGSGDGDVGGIPPAGDVSINSPTVEANNDQA